MASAPNPWARTRSQAASRISLGVAAYRSARRSLGKVMTDIVSYCEQCQSPCQVDMGPGSGAAARVAAMWRGLGAEPARGSRGTLLLMFCTTLGLELMSMSAASTE